MTDPTENPTALPQPEDPIQLNEAEAARPQVVQIDKLVRQWMAEGFTEHAGEDRFAWAVNLVQYPRSMGPSGEPDSWVAQLAVYVSTPGHAGTTLMHNGVLFPHDINLTQENIIRMVGEICAGLRISRREQPARMLEEAQQAARNRQAPPSSGLILPGQGDLPAVNGNGAMTFDDMERMMRGGGR
jgi:hypothetical protein